MFERASREAFTSLPVQCCARCLSFQTEFKDSLGGGALAGTLASFRHQLARVFAEAILRGHSEYAAAGQNPTAHVSLSLPTQTHESGTESDARAALCEALLAVPLLTWRAAFMFASLEAQQAG